MHDPDYRTAFEDFTTFITVLSEKVTEADETVPELPVKDIVRSRTTHCAREKQLFTEFRYTEFIEVRLKISRERVKD